VRGLDLRFVEPDPLAPVDVLFSATPHGVAMGQVEAFRAACDLLVDCSADFRLEDAEAYEEHYDGHDAPEHLADAVYGLPERHREERAAMDGTGIVAAPGCNAAATTLALAPLADAGLLADGETVVDLKVGSSEGGAGGGLAGSHAERSGVVRPYAPAGHRHEAEIEAELGVGVAFTAHAVDMVRGAAATCHAFPTDAVDTADCWGLYRDAYADEPFVRLQAGGSGAYRYPEPKAVAGTNLAEVGFVHDDDGGRVVAFGAIDNLVKGTAGSAVQSANLALGYDETAGLSFGGLHPVGKP
jgi:N-acetyl-gamma-glutamyl-phosphate/LysW-gamma-L-alpha-aminoadipyl-6-phosphate reductase